ncbi:MAG: hypothetical protein K2O15_14240 [Lachnospiraceae bacterium]|nr:hypothetical protein [Lachnospiraceae bacterium]
MTNKEKYKKAFSAVHPSDEFSLEVEKMKRIRKRYVCKKMAASILCCVLFMTSAKVAYAMDVGGIQRTVQLWIQGDCTNVTVQFEGDGTYSMEYTDADGNEQFRGGGGVEFASDGSEIPLSEEEIMEYLTMPDVEYKDDGSVWVYWYDQKVDITDKFVDGVCYVKFVKDKEPMYVTVKYHGGFAAGPHKYVDPDSWVSN